jgi:phage tail-like protein
MIAARDPTTGSPEHTRSPHPLLGDFPPTVSAPGEDLPPSVSARALLRRGLPAIYQDPPDGFAMRFLEALERVLDPRVAVIDCRASYLACDLAPEDMVDEMAGWLGLDPDELPPGRARVVLAHASELARWRGTLRGIKRALELCFPDLSLEVKDRGGVLGPAAPDLPRDDDVGLVVSSRVSLSPDQWAAIARVIERQLPMQLKPHLESGEQSGALEDTP